MYAREEKEGRRRDLGERRNADLSIKSTTQGDTTVTNLAPSRKNASSHVRHVTMGFRSGS